ncbi:VOC family protein [Arthrobacter woluwensis]|jgi:predicted 3-demethylubiquinone-9 3-methyltransferase (glyoxalase superfamily)|uniref:Glyoxalase superfamily enzyme, possibly 3-demethylubiquinone-9 3-methyltransferase n=1 Tax=Arthrobacter woluwensis TaxID=156980 RepID=A0A1H4KNH5_9MICC|nr:VOC family protein [Arthrobacter woluwensis]QTF72742.1 VOC family protein [Arthrobacter woluwensis]SEB60060.1 Glyoxalase superfamily enzyme, possibly 3-demethylubiquinone-9 3-methyltransferase [Arthrobacter woluwensis]
MSSITNCLWFDGQAEEAAEFYVSVFPDSSVTAVSRYGEGAPFPAGTALTVEFQLNGTPYQGLNGGPHYTFNEAISFSISCADQAEVDYYWDKLTADGGSEGQCGWLKDKFGVSWQVVPEALGSIMSRDDAAGVGRAMQAFMGMQKFDIAALEAAYRGE